MVYMSTLSHNHYYVWRTGGIYDHSLHYFRTVMYSNNDTHEIVTVSKYVLTPAAWCTDAMMQTLNDNTISV